MYRNTHAIKTQSENRRATQRNEMKWNAKGRDKKAKRRNEDNKNWFVSAAGAAAVLFDDQIRNAGPSPHLQCPVFRGLILTTAGTKPRKRARFNDEQLASDYG